MNDFTATAAAEIPDYVHAIKARIGRLPDDQRAEVLSDLAAHLEEVQSEVAGESLIGQLGTPDEYAVEFVASLGIDTERTGTRASWTAFIAAARNLTNSRVAIRTRRWLEPMESAWWGISGFIIGLALSWDWLGLGVSNPVPADRFVAVVAIFGFVGVTANVGNRRRNNKMWSWAAGLITVAAIVASVALIANTRDVGAIYYDQSSTITTTSIPGEASTIFGP